MSQKAKKLIIETSCVPVALGESAPAHAAHFHAQIGDGEIWSSTYIRKEFVRRWIRGYIEDACLVEHFGTLDEALGHTQEDFSIRTVKIGLHMVRALLQEKGELTNQKAAGKEIGRMAVRKLKAFDRAFAKRIKNTCRCQTGGKQLVVDYNNFFDSLRRFVEAIDDFKNCPVNEFLDFKDARGPAKTLLSDSQASETKAGMKLAEYVTSQADINCYRCSKIGDAIIAMEQPRAWVIVHIDSDFVALCAAREREQIQIKSRRTAVRDSGAAPPAFP